MKRIIPRDGAALGGKSPRPSKRTQNPGGWYSRTSAGRCRSYQVRVLRAPHHCVPQHTQRSTGQAPALFQLCSPFPSSGCSTVAAGAPRMRYLAPRVASLAAATSRYCTLLYPRLARRSPLSTRACRRPVRSRRTSSRRWLLFHQSRVFFFLLVSFLLPFFVPEIVCFAA